MQVLIFMVAGKKYAIPIDMVETIENKSSLTIVPKSKEDILGLTSIRGGVVPVINAGSILTGVPSSELEKLIVIQHVNEKYALAVDDVDDVLEVEADKVKIVNDDEELSVIMLDEELVYLVTAKLFTKISK